MILSHVFTSRFSIAVFLICVSVPITILLYMCVGMFENKLKPNNLVIKTNNIMFDEYLKKFNKSYSSDEYNRRLSYFMDSLKEISRLNNITGAVHGLTIFSDMSKKEFSMMMTPSGRFKGTANIKKNCLDNTLVNIEDFNFYGNTNDLPVVVDWRTEGNIGPVLSQKKCGGCWAFSAVGLVESMALIQKIEKTYTRRSIQELLDCVDLCHGCSGGTVAEAFEYLCRHNLSITTEKKYPLTLVNQTCNVPHSVEGRRIKEYSVHLNLNEEKMQYLLAKHGPLAVVVNAGPLMHYIDGIIQRSCFRSEDGYSNDHVVQLVGYDKSGSIPYYMARNSWGPEFGIKGYMKLIMNKNICGVSDIVTWLKVY